MDVGGLIWTTERMKCDTQGGDCQSTWGDGDDDDSDGDDGVDGDGEEDVNDDDGD